MSLPWVSRSAHDAIVAELRASVVVAEGRALSEYHRATDFSVRFDDLLEKYHAALDRVLPVPPSPVMATAVREPRTPDVVQQAIRDEAAGDSRLAGFLRKRANELKAEGKKPEEVADELRNWQTTATDGQS